MSLISCMVLTGCSDTSEGSEAELLQMLQRKILHPEVFVKLPADGSREDDTQKKKS